MMQLLPTYEFLYRPDDPLVVKFMQDLKDELNALGRIHKVTKWPNTPKDIVDAMRAVLRGDYRDSWGYYFWKELAKAVGHPLFFYRLEPAVSNNQLTHATFMTNVGMLASTRQMMTAEGELFNPSPEVPAEDEATSSALPLFAAYEVTGIGCSMAHSILDVRDSLPEHYTEAEWLRNQKVIHGMLKTLAKIVTNGPQE